MGESESAIGYIAFFFCVSGISFCVFLSLLLSNTESILILIFFNLLFASLMLSLKGTLFRKACLLLMGNGIGLLWNYIFFQFAYVGAYYLGGFFNALYLILNPFTNLAWIVSFWSISLATLANSKTGKTSQGLRVDN